MRAKNWIVGHQLFLLVVVVFAVAGILAGVGLWLYGASGAAKLDLSRPGYEKIRADVKDSGNSTKPFSATGALDAAAVQDFQQRWTEIKDRLDKMGNFDAAPLSDENLGLTQSGATTPIDNAAN